MTPPSEETSTALILSDMVPREWYDLAQGRARDADAVRREAWRDADGAWETACGHALWTLLGNMSTPILRDVLADRLSDRMDLPIAVGIAKKLDRVELINALKSMSLYDIRDNL